MKKLSLTALAFLCACAGSGNFGPDDYLKKINLPSPTYENLAHCYQYGCKKIAYETLSETEQNQIEKLFTQDPAQNADNERLKIAHAIGLLEQILGAKTGTSADTYGTFRANNQFQQDCVDESVNTTLYLRLLEKSEFLKHHSVLAPDTRFPFIHAGRWPHRTAVIVDKADNMKYAVDSWFHDSGFDAEVVPLTDWKKGWKPQIHKRNTGDFQPKP